MRNSHRCATKVDPDDLIAETDEDNNYDGDAKLVGTLTLIPLDGANSGSVRADGEMGYSNAQPGDSPTDERVNGFLSWDLSSIGMGTYIMSAEIVWGTQCFQGGDVGDCTGRRDPFPGLGDLEVRSYFYDTIDFGDFIFTGWNPGPLLATYTMQPMDSLIVTDAVADSYAASEPFQIYVQFELDTDSNGVGNGLALPEGTGPNTLEVVHMPRVRRDANGSRCDSGRRPRSRRPSGRDGQTEGGTEWCRTNDARGSPRCWPCFS